MIKEYIRSLEHLCPLWSDEFVGRSASEIPTPCLDGRDRNLAKSARPSCRAGSRRASWPIGDAIAGRRVGIREARHGPGAVRGPAPTQTGAAQHTPHRAKFPALLLQNAPLATNSCFCSRREQRPGSGSGVSCQVAYGPGDMHGAEAESAAGDGPPPPERPSLMADGNTGITRVNSASAHRSKTSATIGVLRTEVGW